jgi:uncharacterized membrane protein YfcA
MDELVEVNKMLTACRRSIALPLHFVVELFRFVFMQISYFLTIGLAAGILAGLFGVGGGLVVVPGLVLLAGFSQEAAVGTSLIALLAPVGIGGVYAFYQAGKIDMNHIKVGLLISVGMFVGSYIGARFGILLSEVVLKRAFSLFLVLVAVKFWMGTIN